MLDLFGAGRLLWLRLGRRNGIALGLNSVDHPQDEFEALQLTENFCLKVKWQCVAIGCAQSLEPLDPFGMHGFIVLLCHKFCRCLRDNRRMQHWHRCRVIAIATANKRWMVAIELGTWRCGRIGGAAGSGTDGKGIFFDSSGAMRS